MNIFELKKLISEANAQYRAGNPVMSDIEFDNRLEEFKSLVSEDEYSDFRNSLNEGIIETGDNKVKHNYIMGSLDKLKAEEPDTVIKFINEHVKTSLNVSAKVDGISCHLKYIRGHLVQASTRGDGYIGQDITDKITSVKDVVDYLPSDDKEIDIRGELVILKDDFDTISESFKNPRNACAGIINRKDWNKDDVSLVTFIAYTILGQKYSKKEQFELLKTWKFNVASNMSISKKDIVNETIVSKLFDIASNENPYETDGLVISDDEYHNEEEYRPYAQMAFKLNQLTATSVLIDVEWQRPSKDGKIQPVGLIEPVDIGGSTISRVTLNNLDFIKTMGIKYGSVISIIKSGDIIPKITRVISNARTVDIEPIEVCPCCGSILVKDGPFLWCKNSNCKDQTTYQVMHFIKKLGIDNASFKTLQNLNIFTIDDLLEFHPDSTKKTEIKLYNEIVNKLFTRSDKDIFCCLNMKDLSEILLGNIIDFYGWENIKKIPNSFIGLPSGIGEITMNKFIEQYRDNLNITNKITSDPRYNCVKNIEVKKQESVGSVCFTGSLNTMSRTEASKLAESNGYTVKSSVSKGLTYLVTNDKNSGSSKNKKAQQLGTKIINEDEFIALMNSNSMNIDDL